MGNPKRRPRGKVPIRDAAFTAAKKALVLESIPEEPDSQELPFEI
jgi:hypothetical protein